jgi:hypothetical protein
MNNNSRFNDEFLDILSILSFAIGIANYKENLSQSDKDDLMHELDIKTNLLIKRLEEDLAYQNKILEKLLTRIGD